MQSFYAQYLTERTDDQIIETDYGFATYRYLSDEKTVYIVDIFVTSEVRQEKRASLMADIIVKEAKDRGCTKLIGSVVPSTKNSSASLKVLLGYGMKLDSSSDNFILFRKEI